MTTLMRSGRDRRSENPRCATRGKSACFWLGPISGLHQGPQPERLHLEAGYMTAPVSFREKVRFFSLAPRAPSIHDPLRSKAGRNAALPRAPDLMLANPLCCHVG